MKGGARAVDFERVRRLLHRLGQQVGHQRVQRPGELSVPERTACPRTSTAGSSLRYEQNRTWIDVNLGGPILKDRLYFYASYYRPDEHAGQPGQPLRRAAEYNSTRNEGFGKLTFTPTTSVLFNASYRDSKRVDKSDLFLATPPPPRAAETSRGSRSAPSTVVGHRSASHATFKYTHFTNLTHGRPDNIADVDISTAGHPARHRRPRHAGPAHRARARSRPARLQRLRPALIDRYGYVQNGVQDGRRPGRFRARSSTRTTSSATPGRSPTTSPSAAP